MSAEQDLASHGMQPAGASVAGGARSLATSARLSLGQTEQALTTSDYLNFQLDHALARDAVQAQLDVAALERGLEERKIGSVKLHSAALSRQMYLRRPDLGRMLQSSSVEALRSCVAAGLWPREEAEVSGVCWILADGLSALALERHALPLLDAALGLVGTAQLGAPRGPVLVVSNARVAIGDPIGELVGAKMTVLLIGERPGLSSPDSLGVYLTWNPQPGRTDAERNCISNIREQGLSYAEAAHRIAHYVREAHRLETTGVTLKDPATENGLL